VTFGGAASELLKPILSVPLWTLIAAEAMLPVLLFGSPTVSVPPVIVVAPCKC
jgi:hypothetical protein